MDKNIVLNGDCLELMDDIPDKSVDMILCDLPYGTTKNKWDSVIPLDLLWTQYERIIKDSGAIVLTAQIPFSITLAYSNLKCLKYEWIWKKEAGTGFLNAKKMPLKNHENVLVFYKKPPTYNPQMREGKPYVAVRNTATQNYGKQVDVVVTENLGERYPLTVLEFPRDKDKLHPTQKPVSLFEYLIKTYTNEGETVLDNCAGSGTTAIACINTNRNYILMEKEQKYFDLINKRIEEHKSTV